MREARRRGVEAIVLAAEESSRVRGGSLFGGVGGPLEAPSSYLMKSPPVQVPDPVARENTEQFIAEYGGAPKLPSGGKVKKKTKA